MEQTGSRPSPHKACDHSSLQHQSALPGALAEFTPQLQAFQAAFDNLKKQLSGLEHQASIAPLQYGADLPSGLSPSNGQAPRRQASFEVQKRIQIGFDIQNPNGDLGNLNRTQSSRDLGNLNKIQRMSVNSATSALDVSVPSALEGRWASANPERAETPSSRQVTGEISMTAALSTKSKQSVARCGAPPELEGRWRDLYLANEVEAEKAIELKIRQAQTACQESMQTDFIKRVHPFSGEGFHPFSTASIVWQLIGLIMVLYDGMSIPLKLAWDLDMRTEGFEFYFFLGTLAFWTVTILYNFNAGYFDVTGMLVTSRAKICDHYARSWLCFDVAIVSLDYVFLVAKASQMNDTNTLQGVRLLRMGRLLRIAAIKNVGRKFEELLKFKGATHIIIGVAVFNIFFMIFLLAHLLTCLWYFMGKMEHNSGSRSWLDLEAGTDLEDFSNSSLGVQYARSLHWVIALMTTNTNDSVIAPQNQPERIFTILCIFLSILVLGTGASSVSSTMAALNRKNAEADSTKNQLQRYLNSSGVSVDLSTRIIRFALYSLERRRGMTLDPSVLGLLSDTLASELTVSQRGPHLMIHPLVKLIRDSHGEALVDVCEAFQARLYSDGEIIFRAQTWAKFLCVVSNGTYTLTQGEFLEYASEEDVSTSLSVAKGHEQTFDQPHWFSEISLFSHIMHYSTLTATSFGDTYNLSGADFTHCVRQYPSCIATVYRYAMAYLAQLWDGADAESKQKIPVNDLVPSHVCEHACKVAQSWHTPLALNSLVSPSECTVETASEFVRGAYEGTLTNDQILEQLPFVFRELDETSGPYATLEQPDERKRSLSAVLCVYWLQRDDYARFVEMQPPNSRMSRELWSEWQHFVRWVDMDEETFHAMLVFLAIRGLGKVAAFSKAVPRDERSPEGIVLHLIENAPQLVPSVSHLSDKMLKLIIKAFRTHSQFNLAQMLQGENNPSHVQTLQQFIHEEGEDVLKFYLFNLVGMMSALRGVETFHGSLFLNKVNGTSMLFGIRCLRHLTSATPHAIYWTYIHSRAVDLKLPTAKSEDLALARLACLLRASVAEKASLQEEWSKLSSDDRLILVQHFLADGIHDKAIMFTFLPLYFANTKKNLAIGLQRSLAVLIELLELLRMDGCADRCEDGTINVSLSDVAAFARDVQTPRLFSLVPAFSRISYKGSEIQITISTKHWQRVSQKVSQDDPLEEMAYSLRKMERKTVSFETMLEGTQNLLKNWPLDESSI